MSIVLMGSTSGSVTLQEPAVAGSTVLSLPATTGTVGLTTSQIGMKNRIINGAMVIDQRNAGASITPTTSGTFTVDRWVCGLTQASKYSAQQSTVAPAGFGFSLLITSTSAYSVASGDAFLLQHKIEGFNTVDLAFGTASAQTVTLSFWVRSSLTGTFGGSLQNNAQNRSYPFTYTISSANTWEQKSVTIAGDTTGTWVGATNGVGLLVNFGLGCGSTFSGTAGAWNSNNHFSATGAVSVVGTNGATFYITGVQLELGSAATTFDFRSIGTELALCQRYYEVTQGAVTFTRSGGDWMAFYGYFAVTKRATPTMTTQNINTPTITVNGFAATGAISTNSSTPTSSTFTASAEL